MSVLKPRSETMIRHELGELIRRVGQVDWTNRLTNTGLVTDELVEDAWKEIERILQVEEGLPQTPEQFAEGLRTLANAFELAGKMARESDG